MKKHQIQKHTSKKAFTLVELIIVITILAILASLAFMSFKNYSWNARDSNRISTVKTLQTWLELYQTKVWSYPSPEWEILVWTINDKELTYKWEIKDIISKQINLNTIPYDPYISNQNYVYGVTQNSQEYEIGSVFEWETAYQNILPTTYAANYQAKVEGNYKWYILFNSGSQKEETWVANIPSLIYSFSWVLGQTGNLLNQEQTYYSINNGTNLPYQLNGNSLNIKQNSDRVLQEKNKNSDAKLLVISKKDIAEENLPADITNDILYASFWVENKKDLEALITGKISTKIEYKNCEFQWKIIPHLQTITLYNKENIDKFSSQTCNESFQVKTCTNGTLSWDEEYQYPTCIKWIINNCSANTAYTYNNHLYSLPNLQHGENTNNIVSTHINENNWVFQYTLENISCNDGEFINPNETSSPNLISCDSNYTQNGNNCVLKNYQVSWVISNLWTWNIQVCGNNVTTNSNWEYSLSIPHGTICNNSNTTLPAKTGYTCNIQTTLPITLSKNENIQGTCIPNNYTITLNNNGWVGWTTSVNVLYDNPLITITPPTKANCSFQGYFTDVNWTGTKYYNINWTSNIWNFTQTSNITLYAKWECWDVIYIKDTRNNALFALYKIKTSFNVNGARNEASPWILHKFCTDLWKAVIQIWTSNQWNCASYWANRVILSNSSWNNCGNNLDYLMSSIYQNESNIAVPSGIKIWWLGHYTSDYCTLISTTNGIPWNNWVGGLLNATTYNCGWTIPFNVGDYVACGR